MQKAPEHKIKAIIQAAGSAQPPATPQPKPRQRRPASPAPAAVHPQVTTLVIHGGHNVIATHGAVVHWHHINPSQP